MQLEEEAAELAVFAAACLNIGNEHIPYSYHHEDYADFGSWTRLACQAQHWLGANAPRYVYAAAVEDIIVAASTVRA